MEELSTKDKGDISELHVLAKLTEIGYDVYTPYGENTRSDILVDTGSIKKVQVKTCNSENKDSSSVFFECRSTRYNSNGPSTEGYQGDIDFFIAFWRPGRELYCVPINEAPKTRMYIRRESASNNQDKRINWAEDYRIEDRL